MIRIERKSNGPQQLHRFVCTVCRRVGVWLNHEHQAERNGGIHAGHCGVTRDARVTEDDLAMADAALCAPREGV